MGAGHYAGAGGGGRGKKNGDNSSASTIGELLGFALGSIGLSYDDFCRLRPEEFNEVCKAYSNDRLMDYKTQWSCMRMHAFITIRPHIARKDALKLTPEKLLPLPWEKQKKKVFAKGNKERMAEMFAKYGDKYK